MTVSELYRKDPQFYRGYAVDSVSTWRGTLADIKKAGYHRMQAIPRKLTAMFDRTKIAQVFKSECFWEPDYYYLLVTTDGTIFYID